nr:ribonuclease H-like domain, reverse transcriptase, RNA-dependent DNA polymerase [Tanacetum cinerariifolium]
DDFDIFTSLVQSIGAEADFNNIESSTVISPIRTHRVHIDYPKDQILGDPESAVQTRGMAKKSSEAHAFKVWRLVDLPYGKQAIGTKWVYMNKKDERAIVFKNKARLVAQGHKQEEGIYYDEVFTFVARIEAIGIFLAFASFMACIVYQMDVKSAFLYETIEKEVFDALKIPDEFHRGYILLRTAARTPIETQKPLVKNEKTADVDIHLYKSMIGSLMHLKASRPNIIFAVCACSRFQVTPKLSHLHVVKQLFRFQVTPKLSHLHVVKQLFRYLKDSDYARANLDKKSTTGGCQFLGRRLISWQCKKHTIVATSTTEAEYVAAANCCG